MAMPSASPSETWTAAIHLADPAFTCRVDVADAYVLPSTHVSLEQQQEKSTDVCPAALVSPCMLTTATTASSFMSLSVPHGVAQLETVPLAWRCPSCGSLDVEQLFWRRPPPRQPVLAGRETRLLSAADRRAAALHVLRLQGLSQAMKAKLERHRRRRERRDDMRWRGMKVSSRCRQCFLCPRCGNRGRLRDGAAEAQALFTVGCAPVSVSALEVSLTKDMRYFAVCPCCQWHSYQAFSSMEQLMAYLDTTIGEEKAEVMRDWRAAQRSANTALRRRVIETLDGLDVRPGNEITEEAAAAALLQPPPQPTLSQAAWTAYRRLTSAMGAPAVTGAAAGSTALRPSSPRGEATPRHTITTEGREEEDEDGRKVESIAHMHPAVALERLRREEAERRAQRLPDRQKICAPPGAVQVRRVADLAQEAWTYLQGAESGVSTTNTTTTTTFVTTAATPLLADESEVACIVETQRSLMGLRAEDVDTRELTVLAWAERYQPAAVVAQQRRAALTAAAAAAAVTGAKASTSTTVSPHRPTAHPSHAGPSTQLMDRTPARLLETPIKAVFATPAPAARRGTAGQPTPAAAVAADGALTSATTATATMNAGGASPALSALYHTPTSAYLQSLMQQQQQQQQYDRPLGLPAYCVPRGRKEVVTGVVWRPPAYRDSAITLNGCEVPCTRVVLLDRSAEPDAEVQSVCEHWAQQLRNQADRMKAAQEAQEEQLTQSKETAVAGDGEGNSNSDQDDEDDLMEMLAAGQKQNLRGPSTSQNPPRQPHDSLLEGKGTTAAASTTTTTAATVGVHVDATRDGAALARKKKKLSLPLPVMLNGADYSAVGAVPYWEYVDSRMCMSDEAVSQQQQMVVEWRFRMRNLNPQYAQCVTAIQVRELTCTDGAQRRLFSASPSSLNADHLRLSDSEGRLAQLPCVLESVCTADERQQLSRRVPPTTSTTQGEEGDASPTPDGVEEIESLLLCTSTSAVPKARELMVAVRLPATFVGAVEQSAASMPAALHRAAQRPVVYAALAMDVLAPLPDVTTLPLSFAVDGADREARAPTVRYHALSHGVCLVLKGNEGRRD